MISIRYLAARAKYWEKQLKLTCTGSSITFQSIIQRQSAGPVQPQSIDRRHGRCSLHVEAGAPVRARYGRSGRVTSRPRQVMDARRLRRLRYDDVTTDRAIVCYRLMLLLVRSVAVWSVGRYWMSLRQLAADVGLTRSTTTSPEIRPSIWSRCAVARTHNLPFLILSLLH